MTRKAKLILRYRRLYEVLRRVGKVSYELDLPNDLATIYPVFHVSILSKFISDENTIVPLRDVIIEETFGLLRVLHEKPKKT